MFALLSAAFGLAGAVWSRWWWGDAALLAALAGVILWRDWRRRQQLATLRRHAPMPDQPLEGIYRLLHTEPRADLVTSNQALLTLTLRKPWGGTPAPPLVRINGQPVASRWGSNDYLLPAGSVEVSASAQFLTEYGRASTTLPAAPGEIIELHYSPPALTMLDGRIGSRPQRSAGVRGLVIFGVAFTALIIILIIADS